MGVAGPGPDLAYESLGRSLSPWCWDGRYRDCSTVGPAQMGIWGAENGGFELDCGDYAILGLLACVSPTSEPLY